ncbi:antibiotic biosynthesis monooxygenase family protein [Aestuariimicrobium ganziense]|uniref:antibiotic biosynthesis monooxygenase family protein n=1 Tax=Aestuariimicrobium ganziense TaxID=2773677 RepID=UPI001943411F|nr:antibiotic biosynthesis monooxygenase family protein [Aestuariimicrobium ganziense]
MIVVNRFAVVDRDRFLAQAQPALDLLRGKPGCLGLDLVRNLDDPQLWALVSSWADVGSYRRALGGLDSKMVVQPFLGTSIDEPSAYGDPDEVGENRPRGAHR